MLPDTFHCFIGVIEWSESEPDIILAASAHDVRRKALTYILSTGQEDFEDDISLFVEGNPPPSDPADVDALKDWYEALQEAAYSPWLTIYGPQSDPAEGIYTWDRLGGSSEFDGCAVGETPSAPTYPASPDDSPEKSQR